MSAQARQEFNYAGYKYMPIKLKAVLMRNGIRQNDWCAAVIQTSGYTLSPTASSQILNWDMWPKNTKVESIKSQTDAFLRSRGITDAEIATVWEVDHEDPMRMGQPAGIHVGQFQKARAENATPDLIGEPEMLSPAAKKHFKLFRNPFIEDINSPDDVFISADIRYVRESMFNNAKHGGLLAVIGDSGSGKSTLRKDLLERVAKDSEKIRVIFPRVVDKTRLNAGSICEAIIKDLQPESKLPQSLESKARSVEKMLKDSASSGNRHVIIIEEAHDLTIQTMKLLKRFYEIEDGFKKLVSIIMVGQPELAVKLDEGRYPEAREFIRRCETAWLVPLDHNLPEYLAFKFSRVQADVSQIVAEDTYDAIRTKLTDNRGGSSVSYINPLLVNMTITKAMNLAAEIGEEKVTADLIRQL